MKFKSELSSDIQDWVESCVRLTRPDNVHWCDGSESEYRKILEIALKSGDLIELNQKLYPNCYLHRSHPSDVARTEGQTYVCTEKKEDVGPTNNWLSPSEADKLIDPHFAGCMRGRTLYVIPYVMGPLESPYARIGVEITDSPYVVLNMRIMTRMGNQAMEKLKKTEWASVVKGLHSTGDLNPEKRWILHYPERLEIKSYGSGYGGNALLGKKCHSLRLGSWQGRNEGWLAEHMLILGVESPEKEVTYIAAAFPSSCGKTNLAMLVPPESMPGYKIWTVGDDICWMHVREDGRLCAINPENGFFGVAPGTNSKTNPNATEMIKSNTIFTNVALTPSGEPWWEGLTPEPPSGLIDWQGRPFDPKNGPAAHPNSRFTVSTKQCKSWSVFANDPAGVPISAIIFGGRRADTVPLVVESFDWEHGVFLGASMSSESTAAATGKTGVLKRDPMAMRPFCGYNMGDYWAHWLQFAKKSSALPKIYNVNWFRKEPDGKYLWKGFGENLRVLEWIINRCKGISGANSTAIGKIPGPEDLNLKGLNLSTDDLRMLLEVNGNEWTAELESIGDFFGQFGPRLPKKIDAQRQKILERLTHGF